LPGAANALSSVTITRWTVEALGSTIDLPALNELGRIEVTRTVEAVDPISGQIVQREVLIRDNLRANFYLNYGHAPNYVLERWGVLIALAAGFGLLTVWAQRRRDRWN